MQDKNTWELRNVRKRMLFEKLIQWKVWSPSHFDSVGLSQSMCFFTNTQYCMYLKFWKQRPRWDWGPMKGALSAQKPFKGPRQRRGISMEAWKRKMSSPMRDYWFTLHSNQYFFTKSKQKKISQWPDLFKEQCPLGNKITAKCTFSQTLTSIRLQEA